jgi:hypothetical protein
MFLFYSHSKTNTNEFNIQSLFRVAIIYAYHYLEKNIENEY